MTGNPEGNNLLSRRHNSFLIFDNIKKKHFQLPHRHERESEHIMNFDLSDDGTSLRERSMALDTSTKSQVDKGFLLYQLYHEKVHAIYKNY